MGVPRPYNNAAHIPSTANVSPLAKVLYLHKRSSFAAGLAILNESCCQIQYPQNSGVYVRVRSRLDRSTQLEIREQRNGMNSPETFILTADFSIQPADRSIKRPLHHHTPLTNRWPLFLSIQLPATIPPLYNPMSVSNAITKPADQMK